MEFNTRLVAAPELARTYSTPSYSDPWDAVSDYQAVRGYVNRNPDTGATAIARRFDVPRSRVRPWLDGSRPDCVRGIDAARERDWLDVEIGSGTFRGLNVLLAWAFSGGSILRDSWVPYWSANGEDDLELLSRAADWANTRIDWTRSGASGRGREIRPIEDASVLGRVLVAMGGHRGRKTENSDISLPNYLDAAPRRIGQEFIQIYLRNRAQSLSDTDATRFREVRSNRYLQSLASFIERLTGESVNVSEKNVLLSADAGRSVRNWPDILCP